MSKRLSKEEFISRCVSIHGNKYDYSKVEYINSRTKVCIICPKHGEFWQTPDNHIRTIKQCPTCIKDIEINKIINNINNMYNNTFTFIEYSQGVVARVSIICKHCKIKHLISWKHLSSGTFKCNCDISRSRLIFKYRFLDECRYNEYEYLEFPIYSSDKVKLRCLNCNNLFCQDADAHLLGYGCPRCNISKGEKTILEYLEKYNIIYETQKIFEDCRSQESNYHLKFDFYLPEKNILIEFDGEQHFRSVPFFGGDAALLKRQSHDNQKNLYCYENNIPLLRIKYTENILVKLSEFIDG